MEKQQLLRTYDADIEALNRQQKQQVRKPIILFNNACHCQHVITFRCSFFEVITVKKVTTYIFLCTVGSLRMCLM